MDMGRPLKLGAAALVILVGLAGLYLTLTPDRTGDPVVVSDATPEIEVAPSPARRPVGEALEPDPSEPVGADRPKVPPANDPQTWRERRVVASADWRERTLAATERFADERGLQPEVRDELLAIQERMFDAMATSRADLEDGVAAAVRARRDLERARDEAREDILALLGEEDAAALQQELAQLATP